MNMKYFLTFTLLSVILLAQFQHNQTDLIETTFSRKFEKKIIHKYLFSENPKQVNAALLSIGNGKDTTWVKDILKTNFNTHHKFITFALANIGPCKISKAFLEKLLFENSSRKYLSEIILALSKIGDKKSAKLILQLFTTQNNLPKRNFYLSFYNFKRRNIEFNLEAFSKLIKQDLLSKNPAILKELLFVKKRLSVKLNIDIELKKIFNQYKFTQPEIAALSISCFQFEVSDTNNNYLFENYSNLNWKIKVELIKNISKVRPNFETLFTITNSSLQDSNWNVQITLAKQLGKLAVNDSSKNKILSLIKNNISTCKDRFVKDELFNSLCKIDSTNTKYYLEKYYNLISTKTFLEKTIETDENFLEIIKPYFLNEPSLNVLEVLLSEKVVKTNSKEIIDYIFANLQSGNAPKVAIAAEILDSLFIVENETFLKKIIISQIQENRNNFLYKDGILAFIDLSEKISSEFKEEVINELMQSDLFTIKNLALKEKNELLIKLFDPELFSNIISNSFKFKYANINTTKGYFKIELLADVAPISVGNFVYLAKNNFFNNVKFHRVVPNFVAQVGDPTNTGWGGPNYEIITESSPLNFVRGIVGMASSGRDTEGSQWFVMHSYYPHLNNNYTIWGKIIEGQNIVDSISQSDKILSIGFE